MKLLQYPVEVKVIVPPPLNPELLLIYTSHSGVGRKAAFGVPPEVSDQ